MLSATPSRQRSTLSRSRPPQSAQRRATPQATEAPELPAYEPPEAPLTAESHRQLTTLLQSRYLSQLKTHLQHAAEKLTDSAGDVNERLSDARVRYEKSRAAQRNNDEDEQGDEDESSEEYRRLAETETKVDDVTGRMEEKMRQIIDCEARLQGLTDAMSNLEREEGEAQAAALGARQTRGQRRRQRRAQGDDDEGDGEEDGDDEDYEGTPERETRERNAQNPPSRKLEDKLDGGADKWNELSLTERYVESGVAFVVYCPNSDRRDADTRAIIPTSASTVSCMTPNSPATRSRHCHTLLRGFRIWRIPALARAEAHLQQPVRKTAVHETGASPRPLNLNLTTLPLNESASH